MEINVPMCELQHAHSLVNINRESHLHQHTYFNTSTQVTAVAHVQRIGCIVVGVKGSNYLHLIDPNTCEVCVFVLRERCCCDGHVAVMVMFA